ncbi:MAG: DUF4760 domain-containing protein [Propionibacteriaceae bacterium]|nr:DUF4760 domain-containing protein [Propionibacteriaceae bacterium]
MSQTIEAWSHLSDKLIGTIRRDLAPVLGQGQITQTQAIALATHTSAIDGPAPTFKKPNGTKASDDEIRETRQVILPILKGMERLGTGVSLGAYDTKTIYCLGRSRFISTYEYFENYINLLRTSEDNNVNQPSAYSEAEMLKLRLEAMNEKATRRRINTRIITIENTRNAPRRIST